ncbi:hypothetical protein pdam_00005474 [Pocillopora damicornis]|uniref:Major facilitator superfamily (MFS) profile domain-containing protein n=1 Tax=Pocillopora damicornis TaxID=46731 RepID=A0A3M6TA94_POCDA|nr:equilibrative nucleotide transporter 8-like [Pocillopora damicornis]RMX38320.1 hypothetical protein pdam_00005474 [Pocillopora damicornis]
MADQEAECEQFIGDDSELHCRNKVKPLVDMLTRKNVGMYLQFILFGIGSVLPIFVIFAAVDYFDDIFPHKQPEFAMNAIYNPLLFCGCFVNLVWGRAASFKWRIVSGFSVVVICMLGFIFLDQLELCGSTCLKSHYWSVLFLAGILGLADAVCQSTLFGLTTHALPPIYTHGLMLGVGLCGFLMTSLRVLTKTATKNLHVSSYYYFGTAAIFTLVVVAVYFHLIGGDAFQRYYSQAPRSGLDTDWKHPFQRFAFFTGEALRVLRYKHVFCHCFLLTLVTAQQYVVIPSVAALATDFLGNGWFPVLLILVYNVGDVIGRGPLALYYMYSIWWAWLSTLVRFFIIAGICLSVPPHSMSTRPAWMATFVAVLGLSTGHLTTSLISYSSSEVPGRAKETVGYLSVLSMTLGMAGGSATSYFMKALVDRTG